MVNSILLLVILGLLLGFYGKDLLTVSTRQYSPILSDNGLEVYYPILSTDKYVDYYQPVVSWKDYTDAVLHKLDFSIPSEGDDSLEIGFVDEMLNLYVSVGAQLPSGSVQADKIGVFSTADNTYVQVATVAPQSWTRIECANSRYLVWSTSGERTSKRSIHILDRSTGEVMTFDLPVSSMITYELMHDAGPGVVLVGDQAYFNAMNPVGGVRTIFCIDILSGTMDVFRANAGSVVACVDGFLWQEPGGYGVPGEFQIYRNINGQDEVIQTLPKEWEMVSFSGNVGVFDIENRKSWVCGPDGKTYTAEGLLQQGSVWAFRAGEATPIIAVKDGLEDERLNKIRMSTNEYDCRILDCLAVIHYSVGKENQNQLLLYDSKSKAILRIDELSNGDVTPFQIGSKLLFVKQIHSPDALTGTIYWIDADEFATSRITMPDRSVKRTKETMPTTAQADVPAAFRSAVLAGSEISPDATAGGMVFGEALDIAWRKMGKPGDVQAMNVSLVPSGGKWKCTYSNIEFVKVGKWFYSTSFSIDGSTGETSSVASASGIKQE